jgi:hypothetical protein
VQNAKFNVIWKLIFIQGSIFLKYSITRGAVLHNYEMLLYLGTGSQLAVNLRHREYNDKDERGWRRATSSKLETKILSDIRHHLSLSTRDSIGAYVPEAFVLALVEGKAYWPQFCTYALRRTCTYSVLFRWSETYHRRAGDIFRPYYFRLWSRQLRLALKSDLAGNEEEFTNRIWDSSRFVYRAGIPWRKSREDLDLPRYFRVNLSRVNLSSYINIFVCVAD